MVSVKTKADIPKDKMAECVDSLRGVCVKAPVDIVATKEVPAFV